MGADQSVVRKTESAIDDFVDLWRRRKLVSAMVALLVAVPATFALYMQYSKLPSVQSEIAKKQQKIEEFQANMDRAERERDKAQVQLAPFLAAAERTFPNEPADQRLELLLKNLERAISSVQDAAQRISPERVLSAEVKSRLTSSLKSVSPLAVSIDCGFGDAEAYGLASDIKGVFETAGWKVDGVNYAVYDRPVIHLLMAFGKPPSEGLQSALAPVFDSFGYRREAMIDDKLGDEKMKIVVGSK